MPVPVTSPSQPLCMPVWVSDAQDWALYEEREIANVDWLEGTVGRQRASPKRRATPDTTPSL